MNVLRLFSTRKNSAIAMSLEKAAATREINNDQTNEVKQMRWYQVSRMPLNTRMNAKSEPKWRCLVCSANYGVRRWKHKRRAICKGANTMPHHAHRHEAGNKNLRKE
jgi:aminoglycoside phosphotransferase